MSDSIIPKKIEFIADEKGLGPTIGGTSSSSSGGGVDRDGDGNINDGTEDERPAQKKKRNERRDSAPRTNEPPRPRDERRDSSPRTNEPKRPRDERREPIQNTPPARPIPNNPKGRDTPARPIPNNPKGRDTPIRPIPNNPIPKKKKQTIYEGGRKNSRALMPNGPDPKNYPAEEYDLVNPDGTPYQREKSGYAEVSLDMNKFKGLIIIPEVEIKAGDTCPPATQDIAINIKNRQNAIDKAAYGPFNPDEPNKEFWQKKADRWSVTIESAKKQVCGNCIMFVRSPRMLGCIEKALGNEEGNDAMEIIDAGKIGYCEALDFKCHSQRTCDAWVVGGPTVTDNKEKD